MKLSADELRKEAGEIARSHASVNPCGLAKRIIELAEKITGEKLPEPFDESKVQHGSVWIASGSRVLFLEDADSLAGVYLCQEGVLSEDFWRGSASALAGKLRGCATYLGQYDFSKGFEHLTKGAER